MSRTLHLLRPSLLAAAITLSSLPTLALAQSYQLPAAPLASTLSRIASEAGIVLSIDPALTSGKTAQPVQGEYAPEAALNAALQGSGLQLVQNSAGSYSLAPADGVTLPSSDISGSEVSEDAWGPTTGYLAKRTAAGSKTDTALVEAPRSISVATREQMEDRAVLNLDDAVRYMPGVVASSYGSDTRAEWMKVRGFVPTQFLDGLPLPKGVYASPKAETWNLERVALLRGPASSVYGQTPPGGMLDMVSRRPSAVSANEVQLQYGNNNHRQISFASTGRVDEQGQFLYGVSGVVRDSDTNIDKVKDQRYNIAPSLTWNIADDTKLTFLSQFTRDDTGITSQFLPVQGTKLPSPVGDISHHKNLGDPDWEYYDRTYYALGYAFEHRLDDVWQFRQNLRYTKTDLSFQGITVGSYPWSTIDADGNIGRSSTVTDEDISQFAVDNNFQADFSTGSIAHTVLLGLDHTRSNTNYISLFGSVPSTNVNNPQHGQVIVRPPRSPNLYGYDYNQKSRQTGLYVQDQMSLDNWRLTLGGRRDWVHTGTEFYNKGDASNTDRDSEFSGNAAISYVFDSGVVPYLSYAESFQATSGASASATEALKPTEGKQWELGVKYQPVGWDALFTAAVYDLRQENVSVTERIGGIPVTSQSGEVKVQGLELEATGNVTEELKLIATYTRTKSEELDGEFAGNRLQLVPEEQMSLWADYSWKSGLLNGFGVAAGARYVGDTYGDRANTWIGHAGSYTVYDAALKYDLGRTNHSLDGVSVGLNVKNLLNKDYISTCDGYYCYYGDQRSVIANVSYAW
ncbi:TonB-dependent siderophore receptor [Pseudomonas sp. Gutcm_11s]|uniref:TonB-dependent siderophore receptor n=1 Tax=Pseudomonas sp. Gutcm_11s TaxID=3026088 RepID=UPI0023620E9F|nr:TonB-dependent siderophore receptor [Pseudomonas sp. Gutcm_11s]MDD0845246.1 TonB-dependent siderophore receptor [Pseudomonas sp. Gutcm_11s]